MLAGQDGGMMTNYAPDDNDTGGKPLALRLRAARESSGLTQAQAAAELGVSRPLLISIEKGTREVKPEELVSLAEMYGKPLSELLRPTPPPPPPPPPSPPPLPPPPRANH